MAGAMSIGRRLILTADDFGRSPEQDLRIERAVQDGVATSVSVMVNLLGEASTARLQQLKEMCSVGLHLNLTEGPPVVAPHAVPSLVGPDGRLHGYRQFARRLLRGRICGAELQAEIVAQFHRAVERFGTPTHVDSHQHVHQLPGVIGRVLAAARSAGVMRVRTTRRLFLSSAGGQRGWGATLAHYWRMPLALAALPAKLWAIQRLRSARVHCPDALLSPVPAIRNGATSSWEQVFSAVPAGTFEMNFHPGYDDPDLALLTSSAFRDIIARSGIQLVGYTSL